MTRGWPLTVLICALASAPLYSRTLGQVAVGVLFALWFLVALRIRRTTRFEAELTLSPVKRGRA